MKKLFCLDNKKFAGQKTPSGKKYQKTRRANFTETYTETSAIRDVKLPHIPFKVIYHFLI